LSPVVLLLPLQPLRTNGAAAAKNETVINLFRIRLLLLSNELPVYEVRDRFWF
jgi:hypothetical protein